MYQTFKNSLAMAVNAALVTTALGVNISVAETPDSAPMDCLLVPSKTIDVSSPVQGVIDSMRVKRGDQIKQGDVIMTLHSEVEKAQVELAKERAAFGMRTVNRNKDIGSLLSDHEKDEIRTDAQIASLELQEITTRLALKTLHSPLTGHVVETFRDEGEFVADDPVVTIVSIDPLYAEIVAPAEFMGEVTKGDKARITLEFGSVGEVAARVISVDPIIDAASGTFRIRLELANKGGNIPSGLPCSVKLSG